MVCTVTETAIFAAGCFWGVEAEFRRLDGVVGTRVGYIGGHNDHPTYRQVCGHRTGHAEAVEVTFDPDKISYEELLERFWATHDPTPRTARAPTSAPSTAPRSSSPHPSSWSKRRGRRSNEQAKLEDGKGRGLFHHRKRIVTEITPAATFWPAEDYHQQYLEKRGQASCNVALRD